MIKSILDTDLYKFSTSNAYFQLYPLAEGTFKFVDRNKEKWEGDKRINFEKRFKEEMKNISKLSLTEEEKNYCIANIPYISSNYWEWLSTFRFDINKINYWFDEEGVFQCEVTDKLYKVTLYEIPVLCIYSEIRNSAYKIDNLRAIDILEEKIMTSLKKNIKFSEFGTRRRFSFDLHERIIANLASCATCTGTSNVYLAKKYNMTPIGTFPHEWMMFHAGVFGYKRANYLGLEDWVKVYDGNLGTALIDTYTTASFLRTLTRKQAYLLSGFRQDSGDEIEIGEMIIKRLKEFNIDPRTKTVIFSNALNFEKAEKINNYFKDKVKVGFGIGTNLTCDPGLQGFKPANIVMKLSKCRMSDKDPWEKCIKISDDLGKHMGDDLEFKIAYHELHLD